MRQPQDFSRYPSLFPNAVDEMAASGIGKGGEISQELSFIRMRISRKSNLIFESFSFSNIILHQSLQVNLFQGFKWKMMK
jgi:hypothetical protein